MQCILPFAKLLPLCYELERVNCYPHYRLERVNCYPHCYGLDCYLHYGLERVLIATLIISWKELIDWHV